MPAPENEATLKATANLSPVSPSPVRSTAILAVPALQHTVDTIDAMVAAVAAVPPNGSDDMPNGDDAIVPVGEAMEDVVDDDSFDDAYGEEMYEPTAATLHEREESMDNDDYAKTFDSPIGPEEGDEDIEDQGLENQSHHQTLEDQGLGDQHDVSSIPRESNNLSLPPDRLTSHSSDLPHVAPTSPATLPANASPSNPSPAQPEADPKPALAPSTQAAGPPSAHLQPVSKTGPATDPATDPAADPAGVERESRQSESAADIRQLVADLTAKSTGPSSAIPDPSPPSPVTAEAPATTSSSLPSTALAPSSSLPPRPPVPQNTAHSYASQHHPAGSDANAPADVAVPLALGSSSFSATAGAPGTTIEAIGSLPPPPAAGLNAQAPATASMNASSYSSTQPGYPSDRPPQDPDYQRQWDQFMADERQYMSEAKWDRFPEGSRIFIGNLSSDKVSKRDVFNIFHPFGRLAQISLKSAYGFVQYHTVDEGRKALNNLQGIEVKGRRIHLEVSRVQEKSKKDRGNRSPDRGRGGRESGRRADKYSRGDDNRASRNSPRRNEHFNRNDNYGGDRGAYHDSGQRGRGRSRSPRYRRDEKDSYRRRSPSPYGGRSRHDGELEIPRRYGSDVPDVQIIMQPDVSRDFATWVEGAFKARGLKTAVMYLHPRMPKDQVIQRQAAEGVLAVVDLDLRAQGLGRIPIHSFDRSGGMHNVRFEQYIDLEPSTAAEVILRAKAPAVVAGYAQPYGGSGAGYPVHQYGSQPAGYPAMQQPGAYTAPPQQAPVANADIASLMGRVDNVTLQQLLSTIQAAPQSMAPHPAYQQAGAKPAPPAADIQAILGSLNSTASAPHAQPPYGGQYRGQAQNGAAGSSTGDAAAQVQNIMAQLARYRQ